MSKPAHRKATAESGGDLDWNPLAPRRRSGPSESPQSYFQSSQDLRAGLEISWQPLAGLPAELAAAFTGAGGPVSRWSTAGL